MVGKILLLPFFVVLALVFPGCNNGYVDAYDDNFIPYAIISFDVWVYNNNTDKEYYAGSVATDYSNAQMRLSDAQSLAYNYAKSHHLKDWDYICCTVTHSSSCVTKVR